MLNGRRQPFAADAGNGWFAGRIYIEHQNCVGIRERFSEFVHEIAGAGIAMRLEDDMDAVESALAGSSQGGANLSGMMAVVVNHGNAGGLAFELETAVNAAKALQRLADAISINVEADAHGYGSGGIQHIVMAGHLQMKITQ